MLFNEKEILDLCKELNIEVVESSGYPTLDGMELTPEVINNFFDFTFKEYDVNSKSDKIYVISINDLFAA